MAGLGERDVPFSGTAGTQARDLSWKHGFENRQHRGSVFTLYLCHTVKDV